jgi:hypothetical protein
MRQQVVKVGTPFTATQWVEVEVRTSEVWDPGKTASKAYFRMKHDSEQPFLDVGIEEYVGESRRAKLCTVRLDEDAMRALYEHLKKRFA